MKKNLRGWAAAAVFCVLALALLLLAAGCATAAALKVSLSACNASLVSPDTVMTPLLPGIFMRLYAG